MSGAIYSPTLVDGMSDDDLRFVREKVNAVSDHEWERLIFMATTSCKKDWTHGVVLDRPESIEIDQHRNQAFFWLDQNGKLESCDTAPILYGTEEGVRVKKGRVFPVRVFGKYFNLNHAS